MTYAELVRNLRAWCNLNRPSVAATAAARGGSSSVAAAASTVTAAQLQQEARHAAMTTQAVVAGLQQYNQQLGLHQFNDFLRVPAEKVRKNLRAQGGYIGGNNELCVSQSVSQSVSQ